MATTVHRLLLSLSILAAYSLLVDGDDTKDDAQDRGAHSDRGGVWFGPRLGKRSPRISGDDSKTSFLRLLEAADTLKYYYDQLPYDQQTDVSNDKVIFTPKLGRAAYDNMEFTPRLGRRQLGQLLPSAMDEDSNKQEPIQVNTRPKLFSPRLGRSFTFSPRLGRELQYDLLPYVRLARSVNDSKAN